MSHSSLCYHNPIDLTTCYSNIAPASYFEFDVRECKEDVTPWSYHSPLKMSLVLMRA